MSKRGRHRSLAKDLKNSVIWLERINEVNRVIIGISESCRHQYTPGTLRVRREVLGGIILSGYSGRGVTDLYINIDPVEEIDRVVALIERRFHK
jgi:hypothetical protein